jgi:hypothetical protein
MYRMQGFADELQKMAADPRAPGGLKNMLLRAMQSRPAKAGLMLGAGGLAGGTLGLSSGRKKGYEAGTSNVEQVAVEALQMGREQGAQAGYQFAMDQIMGKQAAPNVGTGVARQRAMDSVSLTLPGKVSEPAKKVTARGGKPTKQDQIAAGLRRMTGTRSGGAPAGGYDVTANRATVGSGAPIGRGVSMTLSNRSNGGFAANKPSPQGRPV